MYNINFENGMMNSGDFSRIRNTMIKAFAGEKITVGFLGGSITQGSLSSTPETCYAYLVYKWWCEKFPMTKVTYVNAGIGGTPSSFGVARVDDDLLSYNPDFVIVEFSVNDENTLHYRETYEGLVRHILKNENKTGLMLVHNVRYDNMESAEDQHLLIGKHYNLPAVSMKSSVYPEVEKGLIPNREITPDDLHPNDAGHRLLADLIICMLEKIYADFENNKEMAEISVNLPDPITKNGYENSKRLQNRNYEAKLMGFEPETSVQNHITDMFHYGYTAWKKGDRIVFNADCTSIAVQFRKSVKQPTPIAKVIVDGDIETTKILDGNFDETWGDCLYTELVCDDIEPGNHEIEVEIIESHEDDVVPFYLVSVIASKN